MLELSFLIFWFFLLFVSYFSCLGRVWTEFGTTFFFLSFLAYLIPVCLKIMPERGFIIFWIFLLIFSEFFCPGRVWTEFGIKIFFYFFGLSHPVLAKNIARKKFYNFLNSFTIFFGIFLPESSLNRILEQNFVCTFSAYLIPYCLKIMPGRGFTIFWILCYFFLNFLARVEYERNSGVKFYFLFFCLSAPVLAKNSAGRGFIIF